MSVRSSQPEQEMLHDVQHGATPKHTATASKCDAQKINEESVSPSREVREGLITATPNLRAFAMSLCGRSTLADDLVQETLLRAWAKADTYRDGTNLMAWLFTILRNEFYSHLRKRKREVEDIDDVYAAQLTSTPSQIPHLEMDDFKAALALLPDDQREAIILIGASGFSYDEAAEIMGCAIGTVKSRLSRARTRLREILDGDELGAKIESAA